MSWIHRDDLVAMFIEALQNPAYSGPYNATAPKPVRMNELCGAIGESHMGVFVVILQLACIGMLAGTLQRHWSRLCCAFSCVARSDLDWFAGSQATNST